MISALISFLGGSAFRMVWGEVSSYFTAKQNHAQEIDRMKTQGSLDAAAYERNLAGIKLQAEMGVKTIQVQAGAKISEVEADGWLEAVKATGRTIGVAWIDAWNGGIRPAVATWSVLMMSFSEFHLIAITENTLAVCNAALGIYLADRSLSKRGK